MTTEQLEAILYQARDQANLRLGDLAHEKVTGGPSHDSMIDEARTVWHAAEFALGMLSPGYVPKHEAIEDARALVDRFS
jgi:hypothetical protein